MRGTVLREPLLAHPTEVGVRRVRLPGFHQHRGRTQGDENAKDREHICARQRRHLCETILSDRPRAVCAGTSPTSLGVPEPAFSHSAMSARAHLESGRAGRRLVQRGTPRRDPVFVVVSRPGRELRDRNGEHDQRECGQHQLPAVPKPLRLSAANRISHTRARLFLAVVTGKVTKPLPSAQLPPE
jgi:hypothetical protein